MSARPAPATRTCRLVGVGLAAVVGLGAGTVPSTAAASPPPAPRAQGPAAPETYRPADDPGSLFNVTRAVGAQDVWRRHDATGRAVTGAGVTVALLDTGVAPVPGLAGAGAAGGDSFGHGTHLAGVMTASDAVARDAAGTPLGVDATDQLGVAPDVRLLAPALTAADGSTDVSQVVAALDQVAQAADEPDGADVVTLALSADAVPATQVDPLVAAVERAWRAGVVVVVAGGNEGHGSGGLTSPAVSPHAISVGASDPAGRVQGWASPSVADFSSGGTAERHVDLVAPGRSITSLRAPGSTADAEHPEGLVPGDTTGRLFRGSGTSQAAAVVGGAAALLLQARPDLTPDQVKEALTSTADPLDGVSPLLQGAGHLDVDEAVDAVTDAAAATTYAHSASTSGSLNVTASDGHRWEPQADEASWSGVRWQGVRWQGVRWQGVRWQGVRWQGVRWQGVRWQGVRWQGVRWQGVRWQGAEWSSVSWDGGQGD